MLYVLFFSSSKDQSDIDHVNSELILWKVDTIGPLCKSGGIRELARINSGELTAFANVAWIPSVLSSSLLGQTFNSPCSCFIASDGVQLRVYQAVIDARAILSQSSSVKMHKVKA